MELAETFNYLRQPCHMARHLHIQDHPRIRAALRDGTHVSQQRGLLTLVTYNMDHESQWAEFDKARLQQADRKRALANLKRHVAKSGSSLQGPLTQDRVIGHCLAEHIVSVLPHCYLSIARGSVQLRSLRSHLAPPCIAETSELRQDIDGLDLELPLGKAHGMQESERFEMLRVVPCKGSLARTITTAPLAAGYLPAQGLVVARHDALLKEGMVFTRPRSTEACSVLDLCNGAVSALELTGRVWNTTETCVFYYKHLPFIEDVSACLQALISAGAFPATAKSLLCSQTAPMHSSLGTLRSRGLVDEASLSAFQSATSLLVTCIRLMWNEHQKIVAQTQTCLWVARNIHC